MRSPFKFLDSYTLEDKEVFFGRDSETEVLYDMVYKSPLILLYGMSGTGKTSLIQCGLASKFNGPDWYPLWIRRQGNINESLQIALFKASKGNSMNSLRDGISYLFRYYLRPVYLIFDQFEELFVLGDADEQKKFMESIQDLLVSELPVKVVIVMREEYLGQLYDFEKIVPSIFDHRVRVESMNRTKVKEVLLGSFKKYNISLEGKPEDRLEEIYDNLSEGKTGIQLPYLQVYLDMFYKEDYVRTYPKGSEEKFPPIEFTQSEIKEFGNIENVLAKFLEQQESELQTELSKEYPNIDRKAVNKLLDTFATEEGTKRPIYYQRTQNEIHLEPRIMELMPKINVSALSKGLLKLEQNRVLRFSDDTIELAHDSLAYLIDQKRTEEQRQLNNITRQIKSAYNSYLGTKDFLTKKQLNYYESFLSRLELDKKVLQFIEQSRKDVEAKEKEEFERQERELQAIQEKLDTELESARKQRFLLIIISLIALVAIGVGIWAEGQRQRARSAEDEAKAKTKSLEEEKAEKQRAQDATKKAELDKKRTEIQSFIDQAENSMKSGEYQPALENLRLAQALNPTESDSLALLIQKAENGIKTNNAYDSLRTKGNEAINDDKLLLAMRYYQEASRLPLNYGRINVVNENFGKIKYRMSVKCQQLIGQAETFSRVENCEKVKEKLSEIEKFHQYLSQEQIQSNLQTIDKFKAICD